MRPVLLLIGGIVLANIVTATFVWRPSAAEKETYTTANSAIAKGQDPWMANERYNAPGRNMVRKSMLEALGQPYSTYCSAEGRKRLIDAINHYFHQRNAQASSYANTYGEEARRFAVKAWQTTDDNRIERLVTETYSRGHFTLDELRPYARTPLAELVKGARVTARPCSA
jgi:hypothetical protein